MANTVGLVFLLVTTSTFVGTQSEVDHVPERHKSGPRDWGPWTGWSACSQSCGYGTAYRIRQCHVHYSRYSNSTSCQGPSKQFKLCILQNCTDTAIDYRATECAKHNKVYYGGQTFSWIPYINSLSPCELSCKSVGFEYYARFQQTVADFVVCNEDNTAACIQGKCVKSGCDGILDSETQVDRCGVCGGDGTSCRLIRGIFTRMHLAHRGYNVITTIPAGACSINITEMGRSSNHLALSTSSGYFLNGDMRLQQEGEVRGAGTTFTYNRSTSQNCPGECLVASGPLNTTLRVELMYFGRNPGIYYDFTVPRGDTHSFINSLSSLHDRGSSSGKPRPSFGDTEERLHLQNDGDQGTARTDIISRIKHGKSPVYAADTPTGQSQQQLSIYAKVTPNQAPSAYKSNHYLTNGGNNHQSSHRQLHQSGETSAAHDRTRLRNEKKDRKNWSHEGNSLQKTFEPTRNQFHLAGENGSVVYKHYYHTNVHDDSGDIPMLATQDNAREETGGLRRNMAPQELARNYVYDTRYAELRSTMQHQPPARSGHFHDSMGNYLQKQPTGPTSPGDRNKERQYNGYDNKLNSHNPEHELYAWRISGFTTCSESCGGGLQDTRIVCIKRDSQVEVMEENCVQSIKPEPTTITCNNQPCQAKWEMSEWDACSVTCGRGLQKRTVECKQRISPTLTISVSSSACPQPQPQTRQFCQLDPCFTWQASQWSKCSSVCGFGQRTRTISCVNGTGHSVDESLCSQIKPLTEEICDMGSCAQGWFHSKWSEECSSECGKGYYTRQVFCSSADGGRLDEKKCGGRKNKPKEHRMCKSTKPCGGRWFTGPWSQCNLTCGSDGYHHRDVLCIKHHGKTIRQIVKEHNCIQEEKPPDTEPCGPFPACKPQWFVMTWSECSQSCDTGVKTREVKCLDATLTPSPDCDKDLKPSRRQPCNTQTCPDKDMPSSGSSSSATHDAFQMDGLVSTQEHPLCKDNQSPRWCQLTKQARLCSYPHYRKICCHTCQKGDLKHH